MAAEGRGSLNRGDHMSRFGCIYRNFYAKYIESKNVHQKHLRLEIDSFEYPKVLKYWDT